VKAWGREYENFNHYPTRRVAVPALRENIVGMNRGKMGYPLKPHEEWATGQVGEISNLVR